MEEVIDTPQTPSEGAVPSNDLVKEILGSQRLANPYIRFAHGMLNAAGFDSAGRPLAGGQQPLPGKQAFTEAGVSIPEPAQASEKQPRGVVEKAGRLGVMVLRAPVDVASTMIDQLDRVQTALSESLIKSFGPSYQEYLNAVGATQEYPPGPGNFGDKIEQIANTVLAQPETGLERTVNSVARFAVAMLPAVKALEAAGTPAFVSMVAGAASAEFLALDPDTPSIVDSLAKMSPEIQDFVRTYIKDPAPDDQAESTFRDKLSNSGARALFDGALFGALFEGFVNVVRLVRYGRQVKEAAKGRLFYTEAPIEQPMLQEAAREGRPPRQLPPRAGQTGMAGKAPIEAPPIAKDMIYEPFTQEALPAGPVRLQLPPGLNPKQAVEEIYTTLSTQIGRSSSADLEAAVNMVAKKFGKEPDEVLAMLRLGEKAEAFKRVGMRRTPFEGPNVFTSAEGETTAAPDYFRRVFGPEDESTKNLLALVGLVGAGTGAAVLGFPESQNKLSKQIQEAGVASTLARAMAKRLISLGKVLDEAATRESVLGQAAARGARQLVHDEPLVTDVPKKTATQTTKGAAKEAATAVKESINLLINDPVEVTVKGVRKDIHFGKIDTDADVQSLLQYFSDLHEGEITAARRLGTPMAKEAELARNMGMTIEDLHAFAGVAQVLPKVATAANEILVASGKRLDALRTSVLSGDTSAESEYLKQFVIHGKIQRSVAGIRAEAGRTLGMYRLDRSGNIDLLHSLTQEAQRAGKKTGVNIRKLAEMDRILTPSARAKLARDLTKPNATGALMELWINSILSSPKTAIANLSGSVMGMMLLPAERFLESQYSKLIGGDAVSGEASALTYAMISYVGDALSLFAKTLRSGIPASPGSRLEAVHAPQFTAEAFGLDATKPAGALVNALGHIIRTPGRFLMATDDAAKLVLYRGELRAQAIRAARQQGISKVRLGKFIEDFMANPTEKAIAKATRTKEVFTFTNALSDPDASFQTLRVLGQSLQSATQKSPLLKLIAPFIRTPVNLATFGGERTPILNLLSGGFRASLRSADPAIRAEALSKLTVSGAVMGLVAALSASGLITGSGPANAQLQARLREQGIQRNSGRIGDRWISFDRGDPLGMMLGTAADLSAVIGIAKVAGIPDRDITNLASAAVLSFANLLTNRTYLRGLANVLDAIRGGTFGQQNLDTAERMTLDTVLGVLPPNIIAEMRRAIDPVRREMDGMIARFFNRIPGLSSTLDPLTNAWGEEVLYGNGIGPDIVKPIWNFLSPYNATAIRQFPAAEILANNLIPFSGPSKHFMGVELTTAEHNAYKKMVGTPLRTELEHMATLPTWQRLTPGPDGGRALLFQRIRNRLTHAAQQRLLTDPQFKDLQDRIRAVGGTQRFLAPEGLHIGR